MITLNHREFIEEAIDSVLNQSVRLDGQLELLIGDDCSADGTRQIVESYAIRFPNIVKPIFHSVNVGMHENLRAVTAAATGSYLAFLEGDDKWLSPDKLALQLEMAVKHPLCVGSCHNVLIHHCQSQTKKPRFADSPQRYLNTEQLIKNGLVSTSAIFMKRDCFEYPEWIGGLAMAERPLVILASRHGPFVYLDKVLSQYNVHSAGMYSGLSKIEDSRNLFEMYERLLIHLPDYQRVIQRQCVFTLYALFLLNYRSHGLNDDAKRYFMKCIGWRSNTSSLDIKFKAIVRYCGFRLRELVS